MLDLLCESKTRLHHFQRSCILPSWSQVVPLANECVGFGRALTALAGGLESLLTITERVGKTDRDRDQRFALIHPSDFGQHRQARSQPLAIIEFPEEGNGLLAIGCPLNQITTDKICHAKQIVCLGKAMLIMPLLKQRERLLMVLQGFAGLLNIQVPVSKTIEAMSQDEWIVHLTCQCKCLLIIGAGLRVIALRPQKPEVHQGLPFTPAVGSFAGHLKGGLIIPARSLKVPQRFIRLSTQAIERGRGQNRSPLCSIQSARHLFNGGLWGAQAIRLLSGTLPKRHCFL